MKHLRQFALWLVVESPIKLGKLAPWVFGFGINRWSEKQMEVTEDA
jgi:hypothetical protein